MKNPFIDFHPNRYQKRENNVERISLASKDIVGAIVEGYLRMVEEEVANLAWMVEHHHVVKIYKAISETIQGLRYNAYAIEAFCTELDRSGNIAYLVPGPGGLYISALVNHCREKRILLNLKDYRRTFHFLGYRLTHGRTLILQGDAGDFAGAGLFGGTLVVKGSVGSWCGAGMLKGKIRVSKNAGLQTGEWMHGGEIRVDGQINGIGRELFGGEIFAQKESVFSRPPAK